MFSRLNYGPALFSYLRVMGPNLPTYNRFMILPVKKTYPFLLGLLLASLILGASFVQESGDAEASREQKLIMAWVNTALESAAVGTYTSYFNLRFVRAAWEEQAVDENTYANYLNFQKNMIEVFHRRLSEVERYSAKDDPLVGQVSDLKAIYLLLLAYHDKLGQLPAGGVSTDELDQLQKQIEDTMDRFFGLSEEK